MSILACINNRDMTLERIKELLRIADWRSAEELAGRDMSEWDMEIADELESYLRVGDIPVREGKADRDRMEKEYLSRWLNGDVGSGKGVYVTRYYLASQFFDGWCGMRWGGAVLRRSRHNLIVGGDVYRYVSKILEGKEEEAQEYVRFKTFDILVADMTVWKGKEMLQLPVWSGRILPEGFECPEAVADIELCSSYLERRAGERKGARTYFYPIMTGYKNGREYELSDGDTISWDVLEESTENFLKFVAHDMKWRTRSILDRTLDDMRDDYGCPLCDSWDFSSAEETRDAMEGNWAQ